MIVRDLSPNVLAPQLRPGVTMVYLTPIEGNNHS